MVPMPVHGLRDGPHQSLGSSVSKLPEQSVQLRLPADDAGRLEDLYLDLPVAEELDLPPLAGHGDLDHDGLVPHPGQPEEDLAPLQLREEAQQLFERIHGSGPPNSSGLL